MYKLHTFTLRFVSTGWNVQETSKIDIQKCQKVKIWENPHLDSP